MTVQDSKTSSNYENTLKLVSEDSVPREILSAEASFSQNPYIRWAKFILTDDQPNGNKERVPLSEFDNLLKSGVNMPIKMGEGLVEEDHSNASPIGVITHLKKVFEDGVNRIEGLAALWLSERPGDISILKDRLESDKEVNISWEMGASEKILADDGIFNWIGVALKAATVVDRPAYQGRTRIIAMAAKNVTPEKWSDEYIKNLPDSCFLYVERNGRKDLEGRASLGARHFPVMDDKGLYDESRLRGFLQEAGETNIPTPILRSLKKRVTVLLDRIDAGASLEELSKGITAPLGNIIMEEDTVELDQYKTRVEELEKELETVKASLANAMDAKAAFDAEKEALAAELTELRSFKKDVDDELAKAEKLDKIKVKFAEASIVKDEAYFIDNLDKLMGLDEPTLEFMIQELAAFSKNAEASLDGNKVPLLPSDGGDVSVSEIVKALRERKSK